MYKAYWSCTNDNQILHVLGCLFISIQNNSCWVEAQVDQWLHKFSCNRKFTLVLHFGGGFPTAGGVYKIKFILLLVCIWRHQKHDYANYHQFATNTDMACKTIQHVSVPNLKLFGTIKTELWAKEVWEFSITLYGKMGWWAFFWTPPWLPLHNCIDNFEQP